MGMLMPDPPLHGSGFLWWAAGSLTGHHWLSLAASPGQLSPPARKHCCICQPKSPALQVEAISYSTRGPALRQRAYRVSQDIKVGHHFVTIVHPPERGGVGFAPRVDWRRFHDTEDNGSDVGVPGESGTLSG